MPHTLHRDAIILLGWLTTVLSSGLAGAATDEVVTVIAPDRPVPAVLFSDETSIYYGETRTIHRDAALDLCDYLSQVTGRPIRADDPHPDAPVVLHVGPDSFARQHAPEMQNLRHDGFLIKHVTVSGTEHIFLGGIRNEASRWAVERFLQRFAGVRWLFPGDATHGEIVPDRPTITIPRGIDETHEPDYAMRANLMMHYYAPGTPYLRLGPTQSWGSGGHAFQDIFSRDDYLENPEWFALFTIPERWAARIGEGSAEAPGNVREALARGVRRQRWFWDYGNGWQICTSNPGAIEHAVAYARDYFAKDPDAPTVSMGHNDMHGWCECESCRQFIASADPPHTNSEQYWHWVNEVAKQLAATHPDKKITTIAYGAPASPPRFELEENIAVMLTVYVEHHLTLAQRWKKKCATVDLYSYAWGSEFLGFRHFPHAMQDFLKWGRDDLGAISHTTEVYGNWSFDGPKYHTMQALMWDVDADPDALMDAYCHDWFGAAAEPMRAFWDRLEQVYERRGHPRRILFYQWIGWHSKYDELDLYTMEDVAALDAAIDAAKRTANTVGDRYRLARISNAWHYFRTFLVGKLKFADREAEVKAQAARSLDDALAAAGELAELQAQRRHGFRMLRAYPKIREPRPPQDLTRRSQQLIAFNPQMTRTWYHLTFEYVTLFADLRTLLDDLCGQVTTDLLARGGRDDAQRFWSGIASEDSLHPAAQSQLSLLRNPATPNRLVNGGFDEGTLEGWNAGSGVTQHAVGDGGEAMTSGAGAISLRQEVPVRVGQRYRLTAHAKLPTERDDSPRILATDVRFKGPIRPRYEPNYRKRTLDPTETGWQSSSTTFAVPPLADRAIITITSSGGPVHLDDLSLRLVQAAPSFDTGSLVDDFDGDRFDPNTWIDAGAGHSGYLPFVRNGALVFDRRPMATLVSRARFDRLLEGGEGKASPYILRLRVGPGDDASHGGFLECGITADTLSLDTSDSGFYLAHATQPPGQRADGVFSLTHSATLQTHWHQDGAYTGGGNFDLLTALAKKTVWYTFRFDRETVAIHARGAEDNTSQGSHLGTYAHGMTDITSKGPVFLKLSGSNVRVEGVHLE